MYEENRVNATAVLDRRGATATLIRERLSRGVAGARQNGEQTMTRRNQPVLRKFRGTDLFAVKSLVHRTVAMCYPGHYCMEAVRFFANYHDEQAILRDALDGCTLVLDRGGRIFGTGTLVGDEIKRVFVDPGLQKHGLGRLIMQRLEEKAAARGVGTIRLDASLPAKSFYDSLGYATVEKAFLRVENGRRLDFFRMQKSVEKTP
jgi:GNAT superfamily N-acetyltransferase